MYWLLEYDYVPDYVERRAPFRPDHLALARAAYERGEIVLAGATDDPPAAVIVFKGDDPSAAERFVKADPYVKNGVATAWRVRKWNVVIGG